MVWSCLPFIWSGQNHLARHSRERKRWEDNIREWTGLEFGKSQRAVENGEKMEKTGCKVTCGAPTTLAVKGLMMMMMNVCVTISGLCELTVIADKRARAQSTVVTKACSSLLL